MCGVESGESFFKEAHRIHKGKYSYDLRSFKNMSSKISAYCPIHQQWWYPVAGYHIGYCNRAPSTCPLPGCRADSRALRRDGLISYMTDKFGSTPYSYDLVTNERPLRAREVILIICPAHGIFEQMLHHHKDGQGCPKCNRRMIPVVNKEPTVSLGEDFDLKANQTIVDQFELHRKYGIDLKALYNERTKIFVNMVGQLKEATTREDKIEIATTAARQVYGVSYVYHFSDDLETVELECKHGRYKLNLIDHIRGVECPRCVREKRGYTTALFILRGRKRHGESAPDYSTAKYVNAKTLVQLNCKLHGLFEVNPDQHACGNSTGLAYSCPLCQTSSRDKGRVGSIDRPVPLTTTTWIEKAYAIPRPVALDYSRVEYINNDEKVEIVCPQHGSFFQEAGSHIRSDKAAGCPSCTKYGLGINGSATLYYAKLTHVNGEVFYKIGVTQRDPSERLYNGNNLKFKIIWTKKYVRVEDAKIREARILEKYETDRCKRPDVIIAGWTEMFSRDVLGLDRS